MSYTKGELADLALEEIGIASYEFDITPEQRQSVVRRMDMMVASWASKNILIGYPLTKSQTPDPDAETNIPDWLGEAIITNLAIRIAPSYGKQVSIETKANAKSSYNTMCGVFSSPKEMQFNSMPVGAGYKAIDNRFSVPPSDPYLTPIDEDVDLTGGPV